MVSPVKLGYLLAKGYLGHTVPLSVTYLVTYRCDLRCQYCYVVPKYKEGEMTPAESLALIDDLHAMGTQRICFSGGEPLLRPDLADLIRRSKHHGMMVHVTTNGNHAEKYMDSLAGVDVLVFSLDGPADVHDGLRGNGSHERVLRAIRASVERKVKTFVTATLTRGNLHKIGEILEWASEAGVFVEFSPLFNVGEHEQLAYSPGQMEEVAEQLLAYKRQGAPLVASTAYFKLLRRWPSLPHEFRCWAGRFFLMISPGGFIYPCTLKIDESEKICGRTIGFQKAISEMKRVTCDGCYCDSYVEANHLFSLNFAAVMNSLRFIF